MCVCAFFFSYNRSGCKRWRARREGPLIAPAMTEPMTDKGTTRSLNLKLFESLLSGVEVGAAQSSELGVGAGTICWFLSLALCRVFFLKASTPRRH